MTPTDALIEKMARAVAKSCGLPWDLWSHVRPSKQHEYREMARAAYEAEHEETKG